MPNEVKELLLALWPLILLQYAVVIWALVDLVRRGIVKGLPKIAWGIIILTGLIGSIIYLAAGRGEE
jgi:hypothetical protein